jgi:hemerythrin-like domain-containing protein
MKRAPELRDLSEDHHHGLVLARKARQAATGHDARAVADTWVEVEMQFSAELAPHFQIEETFIAPHLEAAGESTLTKRLHDEHRALRECVRPGGSRTPADLARFGELLESHIRFEERELFEVAQRRLSPEALLAVAEACRSNSS